MCCFWGGVYFSSCINRISIEAAWADGPTLARIIEEDGARWEPVIRKADIRVE